MTDLLRELKQRLRKEASSRRAQQPDPDRVSRDILERLAALPEWGRATTVMFYVDVRHEVRTRWFFESVWSQGRRLVVPYCEQGQLGLFRLERLDELSPGTMGVLEPKPLLRELDDRGVEPAELDLIVIPGVAFDREGHRLGYGMGYYDKFLHRIRSDTMKLGVCFESQLFAEIPVLPHDIVMDAVVTERAVYRAS
ncbi:MAG: 5-formyltetrahydrofolate cyclo-ligase [Planctomycetaceae bacterium]|nr:5-formyltetrahydrofolate cyclo-ligase [Planctomycetaceae bacterium]